MLSIVSKKNPENVQLFADETLFDSPLSVKSTQSISFPEILVKIKLMFDECAN